MNLEIVKKPTYTKVSGAITTIATAHPKVGTVTSHEMPYIFIGRFNYSSQVINSVITDDNELTTMCMLVSEKSLAKDWDKEDDDRWNKFLLNE